MIEADSKGHGVRVTGSPDPLSLPFDDLPPDIRVRAFGVEYGHLRPHDGGDLYVTREGWPLRHQLQPKHWYRDERYAREGQKLPGSTGHVYHLRTPAIDGMYADLVIKFSRVAQEVPLVVETSFPDDVDPDVIASARFNSPMEEFGLVMELRRGAFGPPAPRILAQRPLAIYMPPGEFQLWQLGRNRSRFSAHSRLLAEDQENAPKAIELDIKRIYVLLYGWIKGSDAEAYYTQGHISETEFRRLTPRVVQDLQVRGFRVLDNKPKHFILRQRRGDAKILRRNDGELVYGLVDFELLQRTPEHQRHFKSSQHERYWASPARVARGPTPLPSHLKPMRIFEVSYLYGLCPDGGRVWVVGEDADLFDYFLPERWRRTSRVKLSPRSEVYRTRTRDNIDVVYRRSRVGARPRVDPLQERGRAIREHGYNSPFEEVAIAVRLRQMGISTTAPRAVCRTGHRTIQAAHLRDERRFADHAALETPEIPPEKILSSEHDYYTIWDVFRGVDPTPDDSAGGARGVYDLLRARDDGLIDEAEYRTALERARNSLRTLGFAVAELEPDEFSLSIGAAGPHRDEDGDLEITLSIDALTAYEYGLLDDAAYRALVDRLAERLRAVDCEKLDLQGKHLLLSMNLAGVFQLDPAGEVAVTLCNFELIRGLYRPIH
jgi:hypothetical protein